MEIREVKCENCGKEIYVQENYIREKMFCTIGCMDSYFRALQPNRGFANNKSEKKYSVLGGLNAFNRDSKELQNI
ncbi:Uncharacterised protein [uncultured archaeon]|nr:Uncharacterised protein [uncultured archaeon]